MPYPKDDPSWAMLEALDLWGDPFLKSLDEADTYAEWLSKTPDDIALTLAVSSVHGDILNGGFEQCLWNSFGTAAPEALQVIRIVKLDELASLLDEAIKRFGRPFPRSRTARMDALDSEAVVVSDLDELLLPVLAEYGGEDTRRLNMFAADVLQRYSQ